MDVDEGYDSVPRKLHHLDVNSHPQALCCGLEINTATAPKATKNKGVRQKEEPRREGKRRERESGRGIDRKVKKNAWGMAMNHSLPLLGVLYLRGYQAISACGRHGMWQEAFRLLRDAKDAGRRADVVTYSVVMAACRNGGAWQQALALLKVMFAHLAVLHP